MTSVGRARIQLLTGHKDSINAGFIIGIIPASLRCHGNATTPLSPVLPSLRCARLGNFCATPVVLHYAKRG